jgi:hypothetical protein
MQQIKTLMSILVKPRYAFLAIVVSVIVFTIAVWLPNLALISIVVQKATISEVMSLLWSLYGAIGTNFTLISASYTIAIAILFGVNMALLMYYIQRARGGAREVKSGGAAGIGGLISGIFGIGCAACGTFILTPPLALFGATGLLALLPFGGEEFGFLGVGLLVYSIYILTKKIDKPMVCEIT